MNPHILSWLVLIVMVMTVAITIINHLRSKGQAQDSRWAATIIICLIWFAEAVVIFKSTDIITTESFWTSYGLFSIFLLIALAIGAGIGITQGYPIPAQKKWILGPFSLIIVSWLSQAMLVGLYTLYVVLL